MEKNDLIKFVSTKTHSFKKLKKEDLKANMEYIFTPYEIIKGKDYIVCNLRTKKFKSETDEQFEEWLSMMRHYIKKGFLYSIKKKEVRIDIKQKKSKSQNNLF